MKYESYQTTKKKTNYRKKKRDNSKAPTTKYAKSFKQ